jgi:ribonuclease P/MRP protein subunit RPP40
LTPAQHGFLRKKSTCSLLLESVQDWSTAIDNNLITDVVYIDFSKAFDSVSHIKLLVKLQSYGIVGDLYLWIAAFLANRKQRVVLENILSDYTDVVSGVPQGSVLGPLLFLLFVNDLPNLLKEVTCKLFADDVKLYLARTPQDDNSTMQSAIDILMKWANNWQLKVASHKCFILHLGFSNPKSPLLIEDNPLEITSCARDLGVFISDSLKSSEHCTIIAKQAYKVANMIFRCFQTNDLTALLTAYKTYVRPTIEYCSQAWSPHLLGDIDILEKVQRYVTRRICARCALATDGYLSRLSVLNLDPLETRRLKLDLNYCFNIVKKRVNVNFDEFFSWAIFKGAGDHNLKLYKPRAKKTILLHSFSHRVIQLWNDLPEKTVNCRSLESFKESINSLSFDKYTKFDRHL